MKPAPFKYLRPGTLPEALEALEAEGGMARILAGGQSLVPMLHMRLMQPSALIDINRTAGLDDVRTEGSTTVLGPMVRYATIEHSAILSERLPLLRCVVRYIGDLQVRNRGTVGGSLAQADPTGEMPLAFLALGAMIETSTASARREIAMDEFLLGSYTTALEPEEMITGIRIPIAPDSFAFLERSRKHNDFAVINVAALGRSNGGGRWTDLRIALGGVNEHAVLAREAAQLLEGTGLEDEAIAEAAQLALEVADPPDDVRASAEYRRHLVPIYVRRALAKLRQERQNGYG